jgi:hypothetical protein
MSEPGVLRGIIGGLDYAAVLAHRIQRIRLKYDPKRRTSLLEEISGDVIATHEDAGHFREWWSEAKRKARHTVNVNAPLLRRDAAFRNGTGDRRRPNVASNRDQIPSEPVE